MSSSLRSQSCSLSQNQKVSVSPDPTFMAAPALTSSQVIGCDNLFEEPAIPEADRLLPTLPTLPTTDIDSCDRTTVSMAKVSITKLATIEPIYPDSIAS
ncbi:MAG: hypothetical protein F6J93_04375 [Oscillatoria sp. SIO1A7]|nr:hypothetical protein [Oscillatoria sp. SIO1A7]